MKRTNLILFLALLFVACNSADDEKQGARKSYFDLQGYFEKEEARLKADNPLVSKTVSVNNSPEQKVLRIQDWKKELSVFTDADINKTAWKGLFAVKSAPGLEVYSTEEDKVPVKELRVMYQGVKVSGIKILIKNSNALYTSIDTLLYFPDSLYELNKSQHIKLLNEKNYKITGRFNK